MMTVGGLSGRWRGLFTPVAIPSGYRRSPHGLLQVILRNALVVGALGTGGAFALSLMVLQLLDLLGLLTVYGIRILAVPMLRVTLFALVTEVGLTLCSVVIAVSSLLYRPPAALLPGKSRATTRGETRES